MFCSFISWLPNIEFCNQAQLFKANMLNLANLTFCKK